MEILKISVGDVVELKKSHPCGSKLFKIARVGSDVRVVCQGMKSQKKKRTIPLLSLHLLYFLLQIQQ